MKSKSPPRHSNYTSQEINDLIRTYRLIKDAKLTAKETGIPYNSIRTILKKEGIEWYGKRRPVFNKYIELWESLSDEERGYISGLMATDGCVTDTGVVSVQLSSRDSQTIYYLSAALTTPPLRVGYTDNSFRKHILEGKEIKGGDMMSIAATLHKLVYFLSTIGIGPRKTLTLNVDLSTQSDKFKWYFLRGAIDGDGYVSTNETASTCSTAVIGITSVSRPFLETLASYFGGSIEVINRKRENPMLCLKWKGRQAKQMAQDLPKNEFTMLRKTTKLNQIANKISRATQAYKEVKGSLIEERGEDWERNKRRHTKKDKITRVTKDKESQA